MAAMEGKPIGVDRCPVWPRGHLGPDPIVAELLGISTAELAARSGQGPLLVHGDAERWSHVFGLAAAQRLIDSGTLTHPHYELVRAGELARPPTHLQGAVARRALRQGRTVLVRAVDRVWPGVRDLAVRLSSQLEEEVNVNAYLTPGEEVAVPRHADPHDVIVLQLHGHKRWRVFDRSGSSVVEAVLGPGDVLFVPRGWEHEPRAETLSLHLTVALVGPTWAELVRGALSALGGGSPAFDGPARTGGARDLVDALAQHPELEAVVAAARATRLARSQTCAPPDQDLGAVAVPAPALGAAVARTAPLFAAALERQDRAALVFGGRRVDGPLALRDAFRFVADHAAFRVSELPGVITDTMRRRVAAHLVAEGLVAVAPD